MPRQRGFGGQAARVIVGGIAESWLAQPPRPLGDRSAHVWRISLRGSDPRDLMPVLSDEERAKAGRFLHERDATAFVVAHAMLRRILAAYHGAPPESLAFFAGEHGKPGLVTSSETRPLEFNLSHSGDLALIAVARGGPVGVDLEQWDRRIEHLHLAEHFFSLAEQTALRSLAHELESTTEGFFNAWTRKEAYLKATGAGITRGLHHFDVSLMPGEPATLLADRLDPTATSRWRLSAIAPGRDYAGAIVVPHVVDEIVLFDAI